MILVCVLYALFGATFILIKETLKYGSYIDLTFARGLIISIAFAPWIILYRQEIPSLIKNRKLPLLTYSTLVFASYLSLHWAAKHVHPVQSAVYYTLAPFVTALIGHFFFKEKVTRIKLQGILVSAVGVGAILYEKKALAATTVASTSFFADAILILAVTCYSLSWLVIKRTIRKEDAPPAVINGISSFFVLLATTPLLFTQGYFPTQLSGNFWYWAILEGLTGGIAGYTLYLYLLNFHSATLLALAALLEPCFTALYEFALYSNLPTPALVIALACIGTGLLVFYYDDFTK